MFIFLSNTKYHIKFTKGFLINTLQLLVNIIQGFKDINFQSYKIYQFL